MKVTLAKLRNRNVKLTLNVIVYREIL